MDNECTEKPMSNDIELMVTYGFIRMCAWCKKVQDTKLKWHHIELSQTCYTGHEITHGICLECKDSLRALEQL